MRMVAATPAIPISTVTVSTTTMTTVPLRFNPLQLRPVFGATTQTATAYRRVKTTAPWHRIPPRLISTVMAAGTPATSIATEMVSTIRSTTARRLPTPDRTTVTGTAVEERAMSTRRTWRITAARSRRASSQSPCCEEMAAFMSAGTQCYTALGSALLESTPYAGCLLSLGIGAAGTALDCGVFGLDFDCGLSALANSIAGIAGCVPVVGQAIGIGIPCTIAAGQSAQAFACVFNNRKGIGGFEIPNPIEDQLALLDAHDRIFREIIGADAWFEVDPDEGALGSAILNRLFADLGDDADSGELISLSEAESLLAMTRPSSISKSDVEELIDRLQRFVNGDLKGEIDRDALLLATEEFVALGDDLVNDGWGHVARRIPHRL